MIIAGVEGAIRSLNHVETLKIRNAVTQVLHRSNQQTVPSNRYHSTINRLRKYGSIVITKSDKGNQTVVLDSADYKKKMMDILTDEDTFKPISEKEKTLLIKSFKKSLINLKNSKTITADQFAQFTGSLDKNAYIYGSPKMHKPGVPLRPIIAYHLSPAFPMAKYLKFHSTVYYKKTIPPQYTHFSSNSPIAYKINTVRTLSKRIFTHCSLPIFKTIEKARIVSTLTKAGYPRPFIQRHFYDPSVPKTTTLHRATCFLPYSASSISISRILRHFGIKVHYNSSPSLSTILRHPITKSDSPNLPIHSTGAVYVVSCQDCSSTYVGETGRTTHIRLTEHKRNIRNKDPKSLLRRNECITPDQFQQFTSNLSRVPYIYGLPKTHKPSVPLRPIVAYHLSPALPLAKYLSSLLKPLVKTHNLYSVQDPSDFFTRLKNVPQPRGLTMSTFDVTSLFLCLPHSLIIDGLEQLLSSSTLPSNDQKTILDLFTICLDMNALEFNGCFFVQMRGSPMGSPLSTIAAEIVMSNLDQWLVSHNHLGIEMWSRYVDDIFCLHRDTDHLPILTVLNSYHHDLRFTHNPSCFNCIPFLDVLVINTNGTFQTTVFRKPNFTPSYLHFLSHAPVSHKITTVKTLSKRVYTHCSLALFRTIEKRTVYTHLLSAGYPHNFIDRHFYVPNHKKVTPPLYKNVCVLPFSTTNSDIALFLRKFGIRTFFKNSPSLEASLRHPITKSSIKLNPLSLSNGIYKISCNDCEQCYIGETGRTIATRIREHNRNIRSKDRKSLIFQHMADFDHSFNLDDTISVYRDIGNKYQRLVLEALVSNCTPSFNRKIDLPPQYTIFYGLTR
ncbi:hypothetical protein LAZ67_8001303 [Cordylochernes scorpioides]|uniref:Reverse transcriptase domain-containing protein n=1 Tax=Cordylochernes scorpioides TaxID=51811 RepID=A0ABY6KQ34_9ARAC|nr:hypothetical protein LAZ67_8001303 [Cordylochernes scorpioides]